MQHALNRKLLVYTSFAAATALVVIAFLNAQNYIQLIGAAFFYPPLVYFGLKIFPESFVIKFPKRKRVKPEVKPYAARTTVSGSKGVGVVDIDKRAFLKLIGATGLSFFFFSLLGRRADALLFGSNQKVNSPVTNSNAITPQSPTNGYRISEIDNSGVIAYYGFVNNNGAWFIMKEDANSGTFRYVRGEAGFPTRWRSRKELVYDYFHKLF